MAVHIVNEPWALHVYDKPDGVRLGSAVRQCVGGSRGQTWFWQLWIGLKQGDGIRGKQVARAELIRLCEAVLAETAVA